MAAGYHGYVGVTLTNHEGQKMQEVGVAYHAFSPTDAFEKGMEWLEKRKESLTGRDAYLFDHKVEFTLTWRRRK